MTVRFANYIDGSLRAARSGHTLEVFEPATGRVYATVPASGPEDIADAVDAAARAFPAWSRTPVAERSRLLLALADGIEARLEELALAESVDTGKPIALARTVDIPRAVRNFRFFATAVLHWASEAHITDHEAINYTLRRPRGVAGLVSPWNLPLYLLTWKVAPALATGNTAVAKPSEVTPATAHLLGEICADVGMPPGVLNIVHGRGPEAGAALVQHAAVRTISFTGSTRTGAAIAAVGAPRFKKLALEMGGKNPNLIFADADMDAALDTTLRSSFSNQGQICLCGSRILVEHTAYEEFLERLVERTAALVIGDPLVEGTQIGALVSAEHREKIESYVALAREEGGSILVGGGRPSGLPERCQGGYFVEPTIVTGLDMSCRVNQEEIFGPVVTVASFRDEQEAVALANASEYGLSATLWTRDLDRAHSLADQIEAGTVWVNTWLFRDLRVPFGGMKSSGVEREGGEEALRFFTEPKNVCVKLSGSARPR